MPRKKDNLSPIRSGDDSDSPRRKSRKTDKAKAEDVQNTRKDLSTFGSTIVAQHRTRFEAEDIHLAQLNNIERNTRIFANAVLERDGKERLPTPPPLPESSSRGRKRYRERLNSNDKLASLIMPSPIITQPLGSPGAPPFVPPTQRVRSDAGTEKKGKGDNAEKGKKAPASGKEGSTNEASVDAREESAERSNDKSDLSAADQNNETIDETSNKTKGKMAAKKSKMTFAMAAGDNKFFDEIMQEVEDIMRSIEEDVELPSEFTDTFYPKYKASVSNGETKLDESFESDLKDLDDQDRDKYVFEALTAFISHKYQVRKGRKGELVTQMTLDDWISEDASQMTRFLHSKDLEFTTLRDDGPTGLYAKLREFKKAFTRRNNVPFVQSIWY